MNTREGLHRIKLLGKRVMFFGTIVAVIVWLGTTFLLHPYSIAPLELVLLVINALVLGGAILVIAWIVEGFTKDEGTGD